MRRSTRVGLGGLAIAGALCAAVVPTTPAVVERYYSAGAYPVLQQAMTGLSDLVPIALLDVVGVGLAVWWLVAVVRVAVRGRAPASKILHLLGTTATAGAVLYLIFVATWGLNYRRVPLAEKLALEADAVTPEAALDLARTAVQELNALYAEAQAGWVAADLDALGDAFRRTQEQLGMARPARSARPKASLLDAYFRAAGVDGMTDPFFLETLVVTSLLPFERPFVVAHEWSHLAGFADEGDANFVGWVTCMQGGPAERYSGWLFLYREVAARLTGDQRTELIGALAAGPRADLQAIADRARRDVRPMVSRTGWQVYDRYLRANRVAEGAASYAHVVRLVLGTRFGRGQILN